MNEKILEAFDFLILFGFYAFCAVTAIGIIALLYIHITGGHILTKEDYEGDGHE